MKEDFRDSKVNFYKQIPAYNTPKVIDDATGIPYSSFKELLAVLPPGHNIRVPIILLALTGCRLCELNRMKSGHLHGNALYWKPGKNQRGWRRETLPLWFVKELDEYRNRYRVPIGSIIGCSGQGLRRMFNHKTRGFLGPDWQIKASVPFSGLRPHVLQLKGFRKSFATTIFWREYRKWRDAGVALEFASKRLRHSTKGMTAHHYLKEFDHVEVEGWDQFLNGEKALLVQARLPDFGLETGGRRGL